MIRKSIIFGLLAFVGLSFFLNSCETEVDLMAPYKSTAVIIGIMDYTVDTQFVRINRTFLGSGDANVYAQIKDSVEYDPSEVSAWLYKKRNGIIQDSIELHYIIKPYRDPGVFYNQNVGFYYTAEPLFTDDEITDIQQYPYLSNPVSMTYMLKVNARGTIYTAETDFPGISGSSFVPPANPINRPKLQLYSTSVNNYRNYSFKFTTDKTGARYLGTFRINYDYSKTDGTEVSDQFIDFKLGATDNTELQTFSSQMTLTSVNWYKFIGTKFHSIPGLKKVRIDNVQFRIVAANADLNTYFKIANPVSEFTPVLNTYTNLDNGAIGIFGARTTSYSPFELADPSMKIMNEGEYTIDFCYCDQDWSGSTYVCTEAVTNCP